MHQFLPDLPRDGALEHRRIGEQPPPRHDVTLVAESIPARAIGKTIVNVNSSHKQAVNKIGRGLRVIGTASTPRKRDFALANGAHEVIEGDAHVLTEKVMQLTAGRGVDLAFDHLGGELFMACLRALAPFGMVVSYNIVNGPPAGDVFGELRKLLSRSLAVRTFSIHSVDDDVPQRRGLMEAAIALMAEGRVHAPPATCFALADARRAHELLDSGSALGKIVLLPPDGPGH